MLLILDPETPGGLRLSMDCRMVSSSATADDMTATAPVSFTNLGCGGILSLFLVASAQKNLSREVYVRPVRSREAVMGTTAYSVAAASGVR